MTFETAIIVSFALISASVAVVIGVWARRRLAAREDELRSQASTRGWTFESLTHGVRRLRRWTGTTDGVAWVAESVERPGHHSTRGRQHRPVSRWRTAAGHGPAQPIVCIGVPAGSESKDLSLVQGDGWLATLAQKAAGFAFDKAVDSYFGEDIGREIDAAALRRVEGAALGGFIVMATDPDSASRLLFQGVGQAITDAVADRGTPPPDADRPWVLFWSKGVSLARHRRLSSPDDVERLTRAGLALSRVPLPKFPG